MAIIKRMSFGNIIITYDNTSECNHYKVDINDSLNLGNNFTICHFIDALQESTLYDDLESFLRGLDLSDDVTIESNNNKNLSLPVYDLFDFIG